MRRLHTWKHSLTWCRVCIWCGNGNIWVVHLVCVCLLSRSCGREEVVSPKSTLPPRNDVADTITLPGLSFFMNKMRKHCKNVDNEHNGVTVSLFHCALAQGYSGKLLHYWNCYGHLRHSQHLVEVREGLCRNDMLWFNGELYAGLCHVRV